MIIDTGFEEDVLESDEGDFGFLRMIRISWSPMHSKAKLVLDMVL